MTPRRSRHPHPGPAGCLPFAAPDLRHRREAHTVLRDVDFEIRAGEVLAILGTSGCGKSTLLRATAGLDSPTAGSVDIDGTPVQGIDSRCAFAFQEPRLLPWHTLQANIAIGLPTGVSARDGKAKVARLLDLVGLTDFAKHRPREISGGMAQRASLARALARNPGVLLLDEPFGALDALTRIKMQDLLLDIHRAEPTTVLLVTHDVDEALQLADRIIVLGKEADAGEEARGARRDDRPDRGRARRTAPGPRFRGTRPAAGLAPGDPRRRRPLAAAPTGPSGIPRRETPQPLLRAPATSTPVTSVRLTPHSLHTSEEPHVIRPQSHPPVRHRRRRRLRRPRPHGLRRRGRFRRLAAAAGAAVGSSKLNIDFATYNPLSLVIKEKGWLEAALEDQGVTVNWVQSAGSNKANEALRSGAIDVGSTAGSAALLARANGSPIKTIDIYSQPEWAALVTERVLRHHHRG